MPEISVEGLNFEQGKKAYTIVITQLLENSVSFEFCSIFQRVMQWSEFGAAEQFKIADYVCFRRDDGLS